MIARVRGVMAFSIDLEGKAPGIGVDIGQMGRAPTWITVLADAAKVKSGTMTSSPSPMPSAASARCSDTVPLDVATPWRLPPCRRTRARRSGRSRRSRRSRSTDRHRPGSSAPDAKDRARKQAETRLLGGPARRRCASRRREWGSASRRCLPAIPVDGNLAQPREVEMRSFADRCTQPVESGNAGHDASGVGDEDGATPVVERPLDPDPKPFAVATREAGDIHRPAPEVGSCVSCVVFHALGPRLAHDTCATAGT